jgi:lysophospholipase L1-like esterase
VGGEDADDMAKRLEKDVIARRPDVVIWQTGSNDPLRHVPLDRFTRETRDGVAAMRKAGIEVILMEPQWCPRLDKAADSTLYRDAIRDIGRQARVDVVRRADLMHDWIREGLLTRKQMLASDGLHMTDGGYALLARSVAPEVLKVEDINPVSPVTLGR